MEVNPYRNALRFFNGGKRWIKNHAWDSQGNRCSLGVLPEHDENVWFVLATVIDELFHDRSVCLTCTGLGECAITAFNDHPDTTFADVEQVFEKAAVRWDERI